MHRVNSLMLPTTLQGSESDGGSKVVTFTRVIVMPDGQKWIEGQTPKQLPAPASHSLPSDDSSTQHARDLEAEYEQDQ
jgi:hypothetical protein